jgi:hypothetical protein
MIRFKYLQTNRKKQFEKNSFVNIKKHIEDLMLHNQKQFSNLITLKTNEIDLNCMRLINNDEKMFGILELVNLNVNKNNLTFMLNILSNLSLLSANVKIKIVDLGLASKILDILDTNLDLENQQNPEMINEYFKNFISFLNCIKNISEINFNDKSIRFKISFWNILSKMFLITNSKLKKFYSNKKSKNYYIGIIQETSLNLIERNYFNNY